MAITTQLRKYIETGEEKNEINRGHLMKGGSSLFLEEEKRKWLNREIMFRTKKKDYHASSCPFKVPFQGRVPSLKGCAIGGTKTAFASPIKTPRMTIRSGKEIETEKKSKPRRRQRRSAQSQ